jgi:ABC-2 type transport system ATP-binding protein
VIKVSAITKRYGRTLAVDRLSFTVQPGVVTGFLGPNGAGKSTTMRVVMGLDRPDGGTATITGHRYRELASPLRVVGALLDASAVHPGRSAYRHLLALARTNRIARSRVDEVLDQVGLSGVAGRRVGGFSLGMRQRLGIAAALLGDPPVCLFDEPVNGLDPEGIAWIRSLLRSLAAQGRTVFVSSHLMSEMEDTADRLVVVGRGRLIAEADMAELVGSAGSGTVRVVSPQAGALVEVLAGAGAAAVAREGDALLVTGLTGAQVGDLAAAHGLRLHELTPQRTRLEAAFMELTSQAAEYVGEAAR